MKSILFIVSIMIFACFKSLAQTFESSIITSHTFIASSFINDNEGWLSDDQGMLWHSTDGGESWDSAVIYKYFVKLDFIDETNGFALESNAAYKTTDGGETWTLLSLPGAITTSLYFINA